MRPAPAPADTGREGGHDSFQEHYSNSLVESHHFLAETYANSASHREDPYHHACNPLRRTYHPGMRHVFFTGALVAFLVALGGCHAPPQSTGPTEMVLRIPDHEAFLDATLTVLREHDLPPERVDWERGLAVSHPTTSGQWFEFWRGDSRGGYQLFESSIHTVRRIVTVQVEPTAVEGSAGVPPAKRARDEYRLSVQVDKQRYSAPERQVTTASGALAIYNERLPTTEGLRGAASRGEHWVPLGRDVLLEAYLLDKIAARLPEVEPVTVSEPPAETDS